MPHCYGSVKGASCILLKEVTKVLFLQIKVTERSSKVEEALGQASDLSGQLEDLLKQLEKLRTQLANHKLPRVQSTQLEKQIKDLAVCLCTHACQISRLLCSVAWRMLVSPCIDENILDHSWLCIIRAWQRWLTSWFLHCTL